MKIAIIGAGITGNSAAWLLNQKFDITLYEQHDYIGGHSNTVSGKNHADVDTGFIVYNEWTYPNLIALFDHLNVETIKTNMSFGVSLENGIFEYSGDAILAQKRNLLRPSFHKMWIDILRFYKNAPRVLSELNTNISLGDYLAREKYSKAFINYHILPMAAAIWSTGTDDIRDFPVKSFVRFFVNHGLFMLKDRPQWHTVKGGSKRYVEKLTESFKDKILLGRAATKIKRSKNNISITDSSGKIHQYDHVIMACHSDQSLALLDDRSDTEQSVLKSFPYSENTAYLHTDTALMPKRKSAWSSWNYLQSAPQNGVCLTYWMNKLQPFIGQGNFKENLFVTLNPKAPPATEKTIKKIQYSHPQFTGNALDGWARIGDIQGINRTWFCGAWCGYGFHEDGISAGLTVAEELSEILGNPIKRPWSVQDKSPAGENVRKKKTV